MATYLPSHKPSTYDKQDLLGTAREVRNRRESQDCNIVENKFEFQLYYYIQFQINILERDVNPFIPPPNYGLNNTTTKIALALNNLRSLISH